MPGFDAVSSSNGSGTSNTFSHTCTGTNRALYVMAYCFISGGAPAVPTSVTYNSVAMTLVRSEPYLVGDPVERIDVYRLENPASGANNVVITVGASCGELVGVGISTDDTLQASSAGTPLSEETGGTALSLSPASATNDLVVSFCSTFNETLAVNGSETERLNFTSSQSTHLGISTEAAGTPTTNMAWTIGAGSTSAHIAFAIKDFVAAGGNPKGVFNNPFSGPFGGPV